MSQNGPRAETSRRPASVSPSARARPSAARKLSWSSSTASSTLARAAVSSSVAASSATPEEPGRWRASTACDLAGCRQAGAGELADRLQQAVPLAVVDDERLVDEVGQQRRGTSQRLQRLARGDVLGGLEGEAAGEDGEPAEQDALGLGAAGRGSSRPTPRASAGGAAPSAGPAGEQRGSGRRGRPRIRSGLSARTRAAASSMASGMPSRRAQIAATTGGVGRVHAEAGPGLGGPVDEQPHRLGGERSRPATARARRGATAAARARPPRPATPSGSRLVASAAHAGAAPSTASASRGRGVDHVLAVVEDEQRAAGRARYADDAVDGLEAAVVVQAEGAP